MDIQFRAAVSADHSKILELFTQTFTASDGASEGALLEQLVTDLLQSLDVSSVSCFVAMSGTQLVGSVFTTALTFDQDVKVQMLAPVAVDTGFQGRGFGQQMINQVISVLTQRDVDTLVTYGDPAYYSKVGFGAISEEYIPAPMPLSMPIGWLGQTLNRPISVPLTNPRCVKAFSDPSYW